MLLTVTDVNVDRAEMLLEVDNGSRVTTQIVAVDSIARIRLTQETVKQWFSRKLMRRIEIHVRGREEPIVIREEKIKLPFEVAEQAIRRIAEKNELTVETE